MSDADAAPRPVEVTGGLYDFLSSAFADPPEPEAIAELASVDLGVDGPTAGETSLGDGLEALREWGDSVDDPQAEADRLAREHTRLFVGPKPVLQIHESYYAEDYLGKPLAKVKGTYAAQNLQPGEDLREEADHAAVELAALATLCRRGDEEDVAFFLREHGWWLPELAEDVREMTDEPFYEAIATILDGLVEFDATRLEVDLER